MADDVLVRVENVSKKYCRSLKRSMLYGVEDIARDILHLPSRSSSLRKEEFWAVQDVSFELRRGECLGIIGPNGAGKSTLLKMLNGIILPDKGKITIRGKVGALIEVGAGFHPMLTGRENIYISGAILGLSKKEIDRKFDEIVAFAELEEFIDTPVKHYSSGMYVRLGFAIATSTNIDILILDEILAVGDLRFRAKCYNKIDDIRRNSAVIFVSHNFSMLSRVSDNLMVINNGKCAHLGDKEKGFDVANRILCVYQLRGGDGALELISVHVKGHQTINPKDKNVTKNTIELSYGECLELTLVVRNTTRYDIRSTVELSFISSEGSSVAECNSLVKGIVYDIPCGDLQEIAVRIPELRLGAGQYGLSLLFKSAQQVRHYLWISNVITLFVKGPLTAPRWLADTEWD